MITRVVEIHCDVDGCSEIAYPPEVNLRAARAAAIGKGWRSDIIMDVCPFHRRTCAHDDYVDERIICDPFSTRHCLTCGHSWTFIHTPYPYALKPVAPNDNDDEARRG